jgi:ABC-type lipoprotein release transport system permease subunit
VRSAGASQLVRVLTQALNTIPLLLDQYGTDVSSLVAAELALAIVASLACWMPLRRALQADPADILRAT